MKAHQYKALAELSGLYETSASYRALALHMLDGVPVTVAAASERVPQRGVYRSKRKLQATLKKIQVVLSDEPEERKDDS